MNVLRAALIVICLLVSSLVVSAATPSSGTLNAPAAGLTSSVNWTGGPYTAVTADPIACTSLTCDSFTLNVTASSTFYAANPNYAVRVGLSWANSTNDFDLYVKDSSGNVVCSSGQGNTLTGDPTELADCGQLAAGAYTVQVAAFLVANSTYSGIATLGPEPTAPTGIARYRSGRFGFSAAALANSSRAPAKSETPILALPSIR